MGTIVFILGAALLAATFTLSEMMIKDKIQDRKDKKIMDEIKSLKYNDEIEIYHPDYDSKAVFRGLIVDDISVVVFKNGIQKMNTILPTSMFIKKI